MRLYSGSSEQFIQDNVLNQIAEKLKNAFFEYYRYNPSPGEVSSWRNSLRAISQVFQYANLTDHGITLEYRLPLSSKRLDCIICGKDKKAEAHAFIIELKQWEKCEEAVGENEVLTWVGGAKRELLHPSVQVGQYKCWLEDTHTAFYEEPNPIRLHACSYLHNYHYLPNDEIQSSKFNTQISMYPMFSADDVIKLTNYLKPSLEIGEGLDVLRKIEESKFRPSKKLMDHVGGVIKNKKEYILLDEQLIVYDKVLACANEGFHDKKKNVIIVKGGPGTGKSVIALNLMADLLLKGYNAQYATGSRAFTETLRKIIGTRGSSQFKYFNSYGIAELNAVDVLIADESHRIRKTSSNWRTPKEKRSDKPQIEEIIDAAKVAVFFIDDKQIVRPDEIGSVKYINEFAIKKNCLITEYSLDIQFRCAGSASFVNWINNTLGLEKNADVLWNIKEEFDFKIFDDPEKLETAIKEKISQGYTGRMTAGFCWPWSNTLEDGSLVNDVIIGNYKRPWNARPEARKLAPGIPKAPVWAYDANGINQVGCIYTAQGFEFDYVGVIFGLDLKYDFENQRWVGDKNYSADNVVRGSKDQFLNLIKNTYRVLLSRGMKGCYVYFMDKDTERFFKSRVEHNQ